MTDKKIILLIGFLLIVSGVTGILLIEHDFGAKSNNKNIEVSTIKPANATKAPFKDNGTKANQIDLYTDVLYYIPLSSIVETADISSDIKKKINNMLEISQGCYFIKREPSTNNICIFLQNPVTDMSERYIRHNLQIALIDENGNVSYRDIGYSGVYGEIANAVVPQKGDEWIFDETIEPKRPLKHIAYDNKEIMYSESWNYDDTEPIKYEMKNSDGEVVSVMKESIVGDSGLKREHVFYDESGNITKSLTVNYEGADIVWFSYYDSNSPENSITIESGYDNGIKNSEKVYNQTYQLVKQITPKYAEGSLTAIKVCDSKGDEIGNFTNK